MKHYIVQSNQNTRGIIADEFDLDDVKDNYFDGHKNVIVSEITEDEFNFRMYNNG